MTMGRSVFIEDSIEENILSLYGVRKWATGILIGQLTAQKYYVVHIALTPLEEENDDDTETFESGFSKQQSFSNTHNVEDFNEDWFVQHCRQVNRMLTGGLKILGIFVFGPPEKRNHLQVKFRQVLYLVHKMILNDLPLGKLRLDHENNEQIILQVCSATKKFSIIYSCSHLKLPHILVMVFGSIFFLTFLRMTCFSIDVSDSKASVHPADVKNQSFVSKWNTIHCSICLELKFTIEKKAKPGSLYSHLKIGLLPTLTNIALSIATVNGVLMSDDQVLVNEKQKKCSGKNSKIEVFEVELFLTETDCEPSIQRRPITGQIMLVGTLDSRAFVSPKATVKEAVDAIKCDIIRNLITRCQLLCEDFDEKTLTDDEGKLNTWVLPKRMFVPICRGKLEVSDCIFEDEEPKDVLNRISELIGISVSEKDLKTREEFSDCDNYIDLLVNAGFQTELKVAKAYKEVAQKDPINKNVIGATLGIVAATFAAAIAFFYGD